MSEVNRIPGLQFIGLLSRDRCHDVHILEMAFTEVSCMVPRAFVNSWKSFHSPVEGDPVVSRAVQRRHAAGEY